MTNARLWIAGLVTEKPSDRCVDWPFGRFADGYGGVQVDGKKWRAHRRGEAWTWL
jgi:hypothetical protein